MALWEFKNLNKHNNFRTRIIYTKGGLGIPGDGFGPIIFVNRFKYQHHHPVMAPTLLKHNGKTYLMPYWKEVVGGTTLGDIEWIKPVVKKAETIEHKFKSSSSDKFYITKEHISVDGSRKYTCNCPGSWMAKDKSKGCKHQQELMSK